MNKSTAQKNGPVERANAHGAVFAATPIKGNRMFDSNLCDLVPPTDAFDASRKAGFLAVQSWALQQGHTLGVHRDTELARVIVEQTNVTGDYSIFNINSIADGFRKGYSEGIADLIVSGGRHG